MHILVTNDDGVFAPGLLALAQAMQALGKVTVIAPDRNWSIAGHAKTLNRPIRGMDVHLADGTRAFAIDGAPSDCVALALLGYIHEKIDLVVAGINPYANVGHDLTYSGTVTAAMEAAIGGLPAIAFSIDGSRATPASDYSTAGRAARQVTETVLQKGLPAHTVLNVNVPNRPASELRGIRVVRQGQRIYRDELLQRLDPRGQPYFWIGGQEPSGVAEPGTDIGDLAAGYVTILPVRLDLTDFSMLEEVQRWGWQAG